MKLLSFVAFAAFGVLSGLGHDLPRAVLAQSPQEVRFELTDRGPFRGRSFDGKFRLVQERSGRVELYIENPPASVTEIALEDFRSVRYRSGLQNFTLLSDWILGFDPSSLLAKRSAVGRLTRDKDRDAFMNLWISYRAQFDETLEAFQQQMKLQGYDSSAEGYFSPDVIHQGLQAALQDEVTQTQLQGLLEELVFSRLREIKTELKDDFEVKLGEQTIQSQVAAKLSILPELDADGLKLEFESLRQGTYDLRFDLPLGRLVVTLPLRRVRARIENFSLQSRALAAPYELTEKDGLEFLIGLDENEPFRIHLNFIWNVQLQKPELRLDQDSLKTPLSSMRLLSVYLRGEKFEPEQGSLLEKAAQVEGYKLLGSVLENEAFMREVIEAQVKDLEEHFKGYLPFSATFVVIQTSEKPDFAFEVFKPTLVAHAPETNPNLVARFKLQVPIKVEMPEVNLAFKVNSEQIAAQVRLGIPNPDVQLENLELFWKGQRLSSNDFGARFRLTNLNDSRTRLNADAEVVASNELQFNLKSLSTNLETLSLERVDIRWGREFLSGERPGLEMIFENLPRFRSELTSRKGQERWGQPLQRVIEAFIRQEMASRLQNERMSLGKLIDKNSQDGRGVMAQEAHFVTEAFGGLAVSKNLKIGVKGDVVIPYVNVNAVGVRLRNFQDQKPQCAAGEEYLISAVAKLGVSNAIQMRVEGLEVDVAGLPKPLHIQADQVSVDVDPEDNSAITASFDVCGSANRRSLKVNLRKMDNGFKHLKWSNIQFSELRSSDAWVSRLQKFLGLTDLTAASFVEEILKSTQGSIERLIVGNLGSYISSQTEMFLKSDLVKGDVQKWMGEGRKWDEQAANIMFELGKFLNETLKQRELEKPESERVHDPLTKLIGDNIIRMVNEELPKANNAIRRQRSILDHLIVHFGEVVGEDLEAMLSSRLTQVAYGKASRMSLSAELKRLMGPNQAMKKLSKTLGMTTDNLEEFRWFSRYLKVMEALDACPFVQPTTGMNRLREGLDRSGLSPKTRVAVEKFVYEACADTTKLDGADPVSDWFEKGLVAANHILMNESLSKHYDISMNGKLPTVAPGIELKPEIARVELVKDGEQKAPLFRVAFYIPKLSNTLKFQWTEAPDVIRNLISADPNRMVFRFMRESINEILLKINWKDLLIKSLPPFLTKGATWEIQAPYLSSDGRISFDMRMTTSSGKLVILVQPVIEILRGIFSPQKPELNAESSAASVMVESEALKNIKKISGKDIRGFTLGFLDLQNPFGYDIDMRGGFEINLGLKHDTDKGAVMELKFGQISLERIQTAGIAEDMITRRVEELHHVLNDLAASIFAQVGGLPSFEMAANRLSFESMEIHKGDVLIVMRRDTLMPVAQNP